MRDDSHWHEDAINNLIHDMSEAQALDKEVRALIAKYGALAIIKSTLKHVVEKEAAARSEYNQSSKLAKDVRALVSGADNVE
jgi:hypothetical protein